MKTEEEHEDTIGITDDSQNVAFDGQIQEMTGNNQRSKDMSEDCIFMVYEADTEKEGEVMLQLISSWNKLCLIHLSLQ